MRGAMAGGAGRGKQKGSSREKRRQPGLAGDGAGTGPGGQGGLRNRDNRCAADAVELLCCAWMQGGCQEKRKKNQRAKSRGANPPKMSPHNSRTGGMRKTKKKNNTKR